MICIDPLCEQIQDDLEVFKKGEQICIKLDFLLVVLDIDDVLGVWVVVLQSSGGGIGGCGDCGVLCCGVMKRGGDDGGGQVVLVVGMEAL